MNKQTLKAQTTVGEFTRATATKYTHVVVWNSPRAMAAFAKVQAGEYRGSKSGVGFRWAKDRGYAVTWHRSAAAAEKAASGHYAYDYSDATPIGIFEVQT